MEDDERCCGTGTCLINADGYCWCGQTRRSLATWAENRGSCVRRTEVNAAWRGHA